MRFFYKSSKSEYAFLGLLCETLFFCFTGSAGIAQVIPDQTLDSPTLVRGQSNTDFVITGGTQSGSNLFHSFSVFSLDTEQSALFKPSTSVDRIFGRVTSGTISSINGRVGVEGTADLFLINPAGITFGPNAFIQTGGNFISSSAERIIFDGGQEFGNSESSLLSTNIPIGLGFLGNSSIMVENDGHTIRGGTIFPSVESSPAVGLSTASGKTIALLGGNVSFQGGIVRASDGSVVIGAVQEGVLPIEFNAGNINFNFDDVNASGSITLDTFSLLESKGSEARSIILAGGDIRLLDSSTVIASGQNQSSISPAIAVFGESILIDGEISRLPPSGVQPTPRPTAPLDFVAASITLDNVSAEDSGTIEIIGSNISVKNGGSVQVRSFGQGGTGSINISSDELLVNGDNSVTGLLSNINVSSLGSDPSTDAMTGGITINARNVELTDGGTITTSTFNQSDGGRVELNTERLRIDSSSERFMIPSQISALSLQIGLSPIIGNGGDVMINADSLRVSNGGAIGTSTDNSGNAGNLIINARNFVEVDSKVSSSIGPSRIGSNAIQLSQEVREIFGFDGIPSGNGGALRINTPELRIQNGGLIAVRNEGTGSAGDLVLQGNFLSLESGGQISAESIQGDGGDIDVQFDTVLLTNGSVNATSTQTGNGGNVEISSEVIALLDGSSINANASEGAGGQIFVEAEVLLQSSDSQITAISGTRSELDGVVDIRSEENSSPASNIEINSFMEATPFIISCAGAESDSSFVVSRGGGTPVSHLNAARSWHGWNTETSASVHSQPNRSNQILEAQGWMRDAEGNVRW